MWALPTLSTLNAEELPGWLDEHSLWALLLFPREEEATLKSLKQNWRRFYHSLGDNTHIITLLDSDDPKTGEGLRFPEDYENQVGKFCHDLEIRLDHLPAIFLLNASDGRGPPCWSLRRKSEYLGSAALETLVSDICEATHGLSRDLDGMAWRTAAATRLLNKKSAQEAVVFLQAHRGELISITQRLIRAALGIGPHA